MAEDAPPFLLARIADALDRLADALAPKVGPASAERTCPAPAPGAEPDAPVPRRRTPRVDVQATEERPALPLGLTVIGNDKQGYAFRSVQGFSTRPEAVADAWDFVRRAKTFVLANDDPHVWAEAGRVSGMPCVRGTRMPVASLLTLLAAGHTVEHICQTLYPQLQPEQVRGALQFAARLCGATGSA